VSSTSRVPEDHRVNPSGNLQEALFPLSVAHHPHYSLPSINQCEFLVNCTRIQISLKCNKYLGSELEALNWASTCLSPATRYLSPSMFVCGNHARSPYHGVRANCTSTSIRTVNDLDMSVYYHPGFCTMKSYFVLAECTMYNTSITSSRWKVY